MRVFALAAFVATPAFAESTEVTFTQYTPLASAAEIARRSLTPLDAEALHVPVGAQTIDLGKERFIVRVPTERPPRGYGVLVFIPPWNDARPLEQWGRSLDRFGLILVSAIRSGNDQDNFGRREPLAILAAFNIARLYPVDPDRVFVGGFSGGARVAMRVALAYPDLFRGALLDAGSDPIGSREVPLPPRDLFDRFRRESRLAYVSGSLDETALQLDSDSLVSMRHWCVPNVSSRRVERLGHDLIDGAALTAGLSQLVQPAGDPQWSEACWSRTIKEVDDKLDHAARDRELLNRIDRQYGGLAAPRILEFAR